MLNDALRNAGLSGAAFLSEFDAMSEQDGRWAARRSALGRFPVRALVARRLGDVIVAEATLQDGFFLDESAIAGLMRVPINFPSAVDVSLPGRTISAVVQHFLTARDTSRIISVTLSTDGRERILTYNAPREALL